MVMQYCIIMHQKYDEELRKFTYKKHGFDVKKILKKYDCDSMWSFHKGHIDKKKWDKIQKDDIIFITTTNDDFRIFGMVEKKIIDPSIGKKIFVDNIHLNNADHFILFKKTIKINIPYSKLLSYITDDITSPNFGVYEIKKTYHKKIFELIHWGKSDIIKKHIPDKTPISDIIEHMPEKNKIEIDRFIRDTAIVKKLKQLYNNKCQICNYTFEYEKGKFYSEVHHYMPLEENGRDTINNMVVVCPNHHSEFDYKMIIIDKDRKRILDRNGKKIGSIQFHIKHKLNDSSINSQIKDKL